MEEQAAIPSLLALLLSDYVIVEAGTNKKTIVGVFDNLWAAEVPTARQIGLFARMTDMEGSYGFTIKVVQLDADDEPVVAGGKMSPVNVTDRLQTVDVALNLPMTVFPQFGRYEFQLFSNDVYLGRAIVNVCKQEVQA